MLNSLYVILGAGLWAADTLFRHPLSQQITPLTIVTLEHAFVVAISAVWLAAFHRRDWRLNLPQLIGAFLIGALGSAIATLLFTASFQLVNPTVSILLQKAQPILVISLSVVFLGEQISSMFLIWALIAVVSAFFMSFPHGISGNEFDGANRTGVLLAISAAGFWAISTVIGKVLLAKAPSTVLSFWRFLFGLLTCIALVKINPQSRIELPFVYADTSILRTIFFMALIPGFMGVSLYYRGLSKVPASVATILELSFPVAAMWVNARYLDIHLSNVQLMAAVALLLSMLGVSQSQR